MILDFLITEKELYDRLLEPVCEKHELTMTELAIVLFLANNPEYDTARDIVKIRHLAKSHVSVSLRSLEEKSLLRKESRNGNHRTEYLVLTEASKPIVKDGQHAQKAFENVLKRGLSQEEETLFSNLLNRMYQNASEALNQKEG